MYGSSSYVWLFLPAPNGQAFLWWMGGNMLYCTWVSAPMFVLHDTLHIYIYIHMRVCIRIYIHTYTQGVLDNPPVDRAFGIHVWPWLPTGQVCVFVYKCTSGVHVKVCDEWVCKWCVKARSGVSICVCIYIYIYHSKFDCIFVYVYIYTYVYMRIYTFTLVSAIHWWAVVLWMNECTRIFKDVYKCYSPYARMCVCACLKVCKIALCACMCVCVCLQTCVHMCWRVCVCLEIEGVCMYVRTNERMHVNA